jgi:hypothetical protein
MLIDESRLKNMNIQRIAHVAAILLSELVMRPRAVVGVAKYNAYGTKDKNTKIIDVAG